MTRMMCNFVHSRIRHVVVALLFALSGSRATRRRRTGGDRLPARPPPLLDRDDERPPSSAQWTRAWRTRGSCSSAVGGEGRAHAREHAAAFDDMQLELDAVGRRPS